MGVISPHTGEDLCHIAEVALQSALFDSGTVCHQCDHVGAVGEHLEVWYWFGYPL